MHKGSERVSAGGRRAVPFLRRRSRTVTFCHGMAIKPTPFTCATCTGGKRTPLSFLSGFSITYMCIKAVRVFTVIVRIRATAVPERGGTATLPSVSSLIVELVVTLRFLLRRPGGSDVYPLSYSGRNDAR